MIALASIDTAHAGIGTELQAEVTVEATRYRAGAKVVKLPFYNPARKTAVPV
jgi:glycine cleavage system aminomethyltransferase T